MAWRLKEDGTEYWTEPMKDFPSAFEHQEAGSHYKDLKISPGDYIVENKLGWYAANIVKYVSRADKKGGALDWKKVIHYARLHLEKVYKIRSKVEYSE